MDELQHISKQSKTEWRSWEERYWQCVAIDWNGIEFYKFFEESRRENLGENLGEKMTVASLW